jgi:primary-amine oxidase
MKRSRTYFALAGLGLLLLSLGRPTSPAAPPAQQAAGKPLADDGRAVSWEGWKFRWSIHPRNGLVLEDVSFRGRSVLKYAGLAEIFVPYNRGEPRPEDFGGGIGPRLIELFPGKDCVPAAVNCLAWNAQGEPKGRRVVMMHEEATGLAYVGNLGRSYGKTLVLWCAYNLSGYHYLSRWNFREDGTLMPEIGLTGPLQHTGKGDPSEFGSLVGKDRLFAPSHVHNIYYCLDLDVDGESNVVEEFNYEQDKPGSPSGKHHWTQLTKETSRPTSAENFRSWRVVNPASKNALGLPRSYELVPSGGIYRGAAGEKFAQAELWVTRHHPTEHPADKRPLSTILPTYLNDEPIVGENVVLWYVLHLHHLPRTEDWPGMRVEWASFTLRPRDFLDASTVQAK